MIIVSDKPTIDRYINEKALNEYKMAKALCDLFDTPSFPLRGQLQTIAKTALSTLIQFNTILKDKTKYPKTSARVAKVYESESKLKIFNGATLQVIGNDVADDPKIIANLNSATSELQKLMTSLPNTQGIGEIVRLFAGVCETVKNSADSQKEVGSIPFIKNPGNTKLISLGELCSLLSAYRSTAYGEKAFAPNARMRSGPNLEGMEINAEIAAVLGLPSPPKKVLAGNTRFFPLLPADVVRCMDEILGLPQGASISGTTADTIWATETLSNFLYYNDAKKTNDGDPNLLLLVVAAIVSGYHHTALEVGLPLSINGYITYQPGIYTSFQSSQMATTPSGVLIQKILSNHENAAENRFMYIASESNKKTLYLMEKTKADEVNRFKNAVKMDYGNYQKWHHLAQSVPHPVFFSLEQIKQVVNLS